MNWTSWRQIWAVAQIVSGWPNPEALAPFHDQLPQNEVLVQSVTGMTTLTLRWRQNEHRAKNVQILKPQKRFLVTIFVRADPEGRRPKRTI